MKKNLLFSILSGAFLTTSAQTYTAGTMYSVYTDVNPDHLMHYDMSSSYMHDTFNLNVFGSAAADVQFIAHNAFSSGGSASYISISTLNANTFIRFGRNDSVFVPASSTYNVTKVAKPMTMGEQINAAGAVWDNGQLYLTDHSGSGGGNKNVNDFVVAGDCYIGLKYQNGTSITYAWIRVSTPSEDSTFVKDLSSPGAVGIRELFVADAAVYPNPVGDHFYLQDITSGTLDVKELKLMDICGNEVRFTCGTDAAGTRIDLDSTVPDGCYFLLCTSKERPFTRKIIKAGK